MKGIWKEQIEIKNYEVGPDGNLKLISLFNYLQEAAGNHAQHLGWGYQDMLKRKRFWVLSRMQVEIIRMPHWGEKLRIETWPAGIDRLYAIRDFCIKDQSGEFVCKAVSGWLILDSIKHRVINPGYIKDEYPDPGRDPILKLNTGKMPGYGELLNTYERKVSYNDLDVNNHVNNARYLEWILDAYEGAFIRKHLLKNILISYMNEAKYPEPISITVHANQEDNYQHALSATNSANGQKIMHAIIEWDKAEN